MLNLFVNVPSRTHEKCPLKLRSPAKEVWLKRTATSTRDLERVSLEEHTSMMPSPPPKSESSASKILRHSGITVAFKTTFEVFTRVGPDNSLERLTERSVGLVTDRPSDVYELFVTLLQVTASPSASATRLHIPAVFVRVAL